MTEERSTSVPHFTALCRYCIFTNTACGNSKLSKSINAIFPTAFGSSLYVFAPHFGNPYSISNIFTIIVLLSLDYYFIIICDHDLFF